MYVESVMEEGKANVRNCLCFILNMSVENSSIAPRMPAARKRRSRF